MATAYDQRERERWGDDYDQGSHHRDDRDRYRGRGREARGFFDRAEDEVRSWLGDRGAERRRHRDEFDEERRHRQGGAWQARPTAGAARARDLMTTEVMTVSAEDPVERAARIMREYHCGALPVVDYAGRLIGMVTDRDLVVRLIARGVDPRHSLVADCMTDDNFTGRVNESVWDCARRMSRHQIRRLPIVDDRGQVVGILSLGDLARYADAYQRTDEQIRIARLISEISEPSSAAHR
ncbi:MAG TPA: CBS domain-containing protein [Blastocatellia bacterium]|nr:CBS domain-containing protein [Blastocatellia bacterium]